MGWGGGGFHGGGGGPWGGGMGRGGPGAPQAGLPFAGIPPEVAGRLGDLVADEPQFEDLKVEFNQYEPDQPTFTLWSFLAPYKIRLLGALLLVGSAELMMLVGPYLVRTAIDKGIVPGDFEVLSWVAAAYLGSLFIGMCIAYVRIRYVGRMGMMLMYELRVRVFAHMQRLSIDFFTEEKAGRLMTRMTSDIEALAQLLQTGLVQLVAQAIKLMLIVGIMLMFNVKLTLILLTTVAPIMLVLTIWFRIVSERGYETVRERIADVLSDLSESLAGIRLITFYNRKKHNRIHHRNIVGDYRDANNYTALISSSYQAGTQFVESASIAILVIVGYFILVDVNPTMDSNGAFTIGALVAFNTLVSRFFMPIRMLVQLYNGFQSGNAAVAKLADLLGTRPTVEERADAVPMQEMRGEIEVKNVSFAYKPGEEVLRNINLHIRAGQTVSFVGPTGGGKSTLAKLITRFYDPTGGEILIDGQNLRDVTLQSLRSQLGVVPQEPFLFHGSIRDNITFSRPDATEEELIEACSAVGIDDLIEKLPHGLDTPCHERGSSLSSGERQLLALARAFLSKPRVLVLDEATSNVDLQSEAKIERALDNLLGGRTAIIIAHRLATAMRAEIIVVIDDKTIVEMGTHEELVERGGQYAEMYDTWMSQHMGETVEVA